VKGRRRTELSAFYFEGGEMKLKAVLFDVEGTLLDIVDIYLGIINETCRCMGFEGVNRETVRKLMREQKEPWDYVVPEGVEGREKLIEGCRKLEREEIFFEVYYREAKLFPEVLSLLERLTASGLKVGLVTSGWDFRFEDFDWGREMLRHISVLITRDDVPVLKPAPDPIVECLNRLGISASEAIYVGDSPVDIKAGKAAGTMTIGVLSGASDYDMLNQEQPDMILPGVSDLAAVITI
jgi:HAD superfamily hydrolase (TIGR01509 family)